VHVLSAAKPAYSAAVEDEEEAAVLEDILVCDLKRSVILISDLIRGSATVLGVTAIDKSAILMTAAGVTVMTLNTGDDDDAVKPADP
jgi:hypothetical protein